MNLYAYVGNDPINLKDPTGEVATVIVDEENKTVQIAVKVKYNEGATDTQKLTVNSAIEETFTGEFDGYDVTTTVTEVTEGGDDVNEITIVNGYGRSTVKDNQFMTLYTQNPKGSFRWVGAHEGGHLLGLDDRYGLRFVPDRWNPNGGDYRSVPDPGYEGNIMGDADRYGVKGSQIERIIDAESNLVTRR